LRDVLKGILILLVLFPIVWMLLTAVKERSAAVAWPPEVLPSRWLWSNFLLVLEAGPFARWFLNSVVVSASVVLGNLLLGTPAAYAFARMRFRGKEPLFFLVLATLIVPGELIILPEFIILNRLGWIDTYFALTVPFLVNGFTIFLLRQFFETVPRSLEDQATIDGANRVQLMVHVFVPLSASGIAVASFLAFLGSWNSYLYPLIATRSEAMRTMTVGLSLFRQEYGTHWPLLMAASTIIAFPPIIAFVFMERTVVDALGYRMRSAER
jgi:multiple sugar transport system permease protein